MIIQKRKWDTCPTCKRNNKVIQDELYGCDNCKKRIGGQTNGMDDYLEVIVHNHNKESERLQFCSWICVFEKLKTIKTNYFISLPYLGFDIKTKGQRVEDFWKAIKKIK